MGSWSVMLRVAFTRDTPSSSDISLGVPSIILLLLKVERVLRGVDML